MVVKNVDGDVVMVHKFITNIIHINLFIMRSIHFYNPVCIWFKHGL